nr:glycerophosphoryl diester phosphodiesterase membrane domain-containing protein [Caulobacter sp. 17J80-11]
MQAALVHGAVEDLRGDRSSWGRSLRAGTERLLPAIGLALVVVVALALAGLLLLVPGLVLALMWMAAVPALVVERRGVRASLARSAKLTEGRRWAVLGTLLLFLAFGCVVFVVCSLVVGLFGVAYEAATLALLKNLIGPLFAALFAVISSVMVATIYHELKTAREGEGVEALAAAFD